MTDLAILLAAAAAGFGIAQWLSFPVIPLLLLAGFAVSFLGLELDEKFLQAALELGLTFLVFASGIELNPQRFGRQRRGVLWVGVVQFIVTGFAGYGLAIALGYTGVTPLYIGFALTASSTLVVLRRLKRQGQMFEPFGRLVTGALLVQDLLLIAIIVALDRLSDGVLGAVVGLGWTLALMGLAIFCQRGVIMWLVDRLKLDEETQLVAVLALLFVFIGLAFFLKLPLLVGAFMAGVSLSTFPINGVVRGQIGSLSEFFLAIFLTALGAVLTLPEGAALLHALAMAALVVFLTPPLVTLVAEWTGLSSRSSIESGLLMAQNSEFSLVLGLNGLVLGHINSDAFSVITLVMVTTMALTPFLATDGVTAKLLHWHPLRRRPPRPSDLSDHVLLIGFGAGGMWVLKPLMAHGERVLVIDDDPAIIAQLRQGQTECIRGDGADENVLAQAGARHAKLVIAGMRRVADVEKIVKLLPDVPVIVRVFEAEDAERIRRLGGIPIQNSLAAAETFMEWFEKIGAHLRPKSAPR